MVCSVQNVAWKKKGGERREKKEKDWQKIRDKEEVERQRTKKKGKEEQRKQTKREREGQQRDLHPRCCFSIF